MKCKAALHEYLDLWYNGRMIASDRIRLARTRFALLWMQLAGEPLVALRSALFPFILYKDFGASPIQLGVFCAVRPVMALFSFYWSSNLHWRRDKLLTNLMGAWVLARLPFVFIPFATSAWYLIFAEAIFWMFDRAQSPALMEILKLNLPKEMRHKTFSWSFALKFIESIFLGLLFASLLAKSPTAWKGLICLMSLIGISSIFVQSRILLPPIDVEPAIQRLNLRERLVGPWVKAYNLMRERPDFAHFQTGFMISGFGLMLAVPAITIFTSDVLSASHANVAVGRNILMGIGVVFSTGIWQRALSKFDPARLLGFVAFGFAVYQFTLLMGQMSFGFYFAALLIYGIAQAGSHLLWNLSGPLYAKNENSSPFTMVTILMVGIRGVIAPQLGGVFCSFMGAANVLILGTLIILAGAWKMLAPAHRLQTIR